MLRAGLWSQEGEANFMKKLSLTLALVLPLSACSMATDKSILTSSTKAVAPTLASEVDPLYAVAYLPSIAGPISSVRQTSGNNRVHQTVLYPNYGYGGGENQIIVDVAQTASNRVYYQAPTRRQILSEMKRFFPTMKMTIDQNPRENLHGVYGYASGKSKIDGNCIFAWQVVRNVTRKDLGDLQRFLQPKYASKVRLRYCHPTKTTEQLLVMMDGFRIKEVTSSSLEMLRFAEGAGYAKPAPAFVQPVIAPQPVKVATKPKVKTRTKVTTTKRQAVTVPEGPRVLLPTELDGSTPVVKKKIKVAENFVVDPDAPKIPLPN